MNKNKIWELLFLPTLFFILAPLTLAVTIFTLINITPIDKSRGKNPQTEISKFKNLKSGVTIFASRPKSVPSIEVTLEVADARPEILRNYLKKYNSPIVDLADEIVSEADKAGIDYRLIPAIAQQESNLCKFIPDGSYNCWGWGIHSESNLGFSSYEEGIKIVTEGIKKEYIDRGLKTPEQIMTKYTPTSNGSWARGVREFMEEMQ
jgi:hypothetical protein